MNAPKALLVSKIVQNYVEHNLLPPGELPNLIVTVHQALQQVGTEHQPEQPLIPAVPIRRSVSHDLVTCLECGWRGRVLRGHIRTSHGLNRDEYRARWELRPDHPLTAPGYSERRAEFAKQIGLGRRRGDEAKGASGEKLQPAASPARTDAAGAVAEPAIQASSSRRRRSRGRRSQQGAD